MKTKQMKKRIMSTILALVIGICCLVPTAPAMKTEAASLKSVAKKVTFGEYNNVTLNGTKETVLKVVLKSKGKFYLTASSSNCLKVERSPVRCITAELYNSNMSLLGSYGVWELDEISSDEFRTDELKAGTYYIRLYVESVDDSNPVQTAAYFTRFEPTKKPSIDICITLKRKKSIQLGAIFNNCSKQKLAWQSSKKKVATVTSKGKVTAKKKGTAIISIFTSNGEESRIKVIVK